jgi:hypothetical protein
MHRRQKVITEVSPAVCNSLCADLISLECRCTNGQSVRLHQIEEAQQILLDVMAHAALACYEEDESWFAKQDPKMLARQLISALFAVAFERFPPTRAPWLKQLLAKPRIAGKHPKDSKGDEGLVEYVAEAIELRQNAAVWIPRKPPVDASNVITQMKACLQAGQPIRHLMHRVALNQKQIADRMCESKATITRIVRYGGQGVAKDKKELFLTVVSAVLTSGK